MNVFSTLLPAVGGVKLPVFETRYGEKRIGIAVVVGDLERDTIATPGNECIARLASFMNASAMFGAVHRVGISNAETVAARLQMVLAIAEDGDGIVFLCDTVALLDAVAPLVRVRRGCR